MTVCQIEERDAGRSYPRTCPTCKLTGPCAKGLDRKGMADRIEALEAKLAKAQETLKMVCGQISVGDDGPDETWADFSFKQTDQIFSTLAELTRGKDD